MRIGVLGVDASSGAVNEGRICPDGYDLSTEMGTCLPVGTINKVPLVGMPTDAVDYYPNYATEYNAATGGTGDTLCPAGFTLYQGVCIPINSPTAVKANNTPVSTSLIPGVPDWALYGVGGVLALMMVMQMAKGGR